jgi:hypothetical protein
MYYVLHTGGMSMTFLKSKCLCWVLCSLVPKQKNDHDSSNWNRLDGCIWPFHQCRQFPGSRESMHNKKKTLHLDWQAKLEEAGFIWGVSYLTEQKISKTFGMTQG